MITEDFQFVIEALVCVCESILRTGSKYCLRRPVTSNVMSFNCYRENEEN